jgi:hypothetical protein
MALVACPTGSIGAPRAYDRRIGISAFPELISENVYFCGFTSESSFGAWSYLIRRPADQGGNVLVDSPRFAAPLVREIERLRRHRDPFLTHRDVSPIAPGKPWMPALPARRRRRRATRRRGGVGEADPSDRRRPHGHSDSRPHGDAVLLYPGRYLF